MLSQPQLRTQFLIDTLGGGTRLAELLGVSKSQPTRWSKGQESPGPEASRNLLDLDHVVARASMLWAPDVVVIWLGSSNAFLEGARPIDVLRERGSREGTAALDATLSDVYD